MLQKWFPVFLVCVWEMSTWPVWPVAILPPNGGPKRQIMFELSDYQGEILPVT